MFGCSLRAPGTVTPAIADEFKRSFKLVRALPCDVQLGDHGASTTCRRNTRSSRSGGPNPFIDPATCKLEADISEAMFLAILAEQQKAKPSGADHLQIAGAIAADTDRREQPRAHRHLINGSCAR